MEEKANFLATIEELNESVTGKDEQLKELNSEHKQVVDGLESQLATLEKAYEELKATNNELVEEKNMAGEIIKEMQEKRYRHRNLIGCVCF